MTEDNCIRLLAYLLDQHHGAGMEFAQLLQYDHTVLLVEAALAIGQLVAVLCEIIEDDRLDGLARRIEALGPKLCPVTDQHLQLAEHIEVEDLLAQIDGQLLEELGGRRYGNAFHNQRQLLVQLPFAAAIQSPGSIDLTAVVLPAAAVRLGEYDLLDVDAHIAQPILEGGLEEVLVEIFGRFADVLLTLQLHAVHLRLLRNSCETVNRN